MDNKIKIVGVCGSLRKGSYNHMALTIAKENMPENVQFEIAEIGDLPHYNQDLDENPPSSVLEFRKKIEEADALLIAVAEYNYSISSVLKNAIEWGSRPYHKAVLNRKPIALMGASNGMVGTGRAQHHLRQMFVQTDSLVLSRPEVMISFAQEKFDKDGVLHDDKTLQKIQELVHALVDWTKKLKKSDLT